MHWHFEGRLRKIRARVPDVRDYGNRNGPRHSAAENWRVAGKKKKTASNYVCAHGKIIIPLAIPDPVLR